MPSRLRWIGPQFQRTTLLIAIATSFAAQATALEKRAVPLDDTHFDDWNAGATCRVHYYNVCTAWIWCWGGFEDGSRFGMVVDQCCSGEDTAALLQTTFFLCSESACRYLGNTGTVAVHSVDGNDCPVEPALASQPYCPPDEMFSIVSWGGMAVPSRFVIVVTMADGLSGIPNPAQFGTDRPAAGPTGPQACGTCYPVDRAIHSYLYGTAASPICPGSTFNDGVCDAELFWDVDFSCTISVEESSWGKIKNLYR